MIDSILASDGVWTGLGVPLVALLAKTTLILLIAFGVTALMRRASAGARHLVWLVTLGALLLAPALSTWTPVLVRVLPPTGTVGELGAFTARDASAALEPIATTGRESIDDGSPAAARVTSPETPGHPILSRTATGISLLFAVWVLVMLGLGGSLVWAGLVVRRIVRRSQPLDSDAWLNPLWEISDRLGLGEPPRLLRSTEAAMPFACGFLRPTIVLPEDCEGWSLDRRRAVLLHELAHVRRGDLGSHLIGRIACAVYWFHPLTWAAAGRLRSESERACDDVVVRCGTPAADYAEHLLEIVTTARKAAAPSVALAMARRTEFEGRILSILDPELRRTSLSRRWSVGLSAALLVLFLGVGAAQPVPRDASATQDEATLFPLVSSPSAATADAAGGAQRSEEVGTAPESGSRRLASSTPALLARVLRTDTSALLRRTAAWGLAEHGPTQVATRSLSRAVRHDPDASVREMAAWSLARAERGTVQTAALTAALHGDSDSRVRATAAWTLGTFADSTSADALAKALSDPSVEVRTRSAWALGSAMPETAPEALVALLQDRDVKARRLAAWAVHKIGDRSAVPLLEAALEHERDETVRFAFIRARASLGEPFGKVFLDLLQSPDPSVRTTVLSGLSGRGAGHWHWHWHDTRPSP